MAKAAPVRHAQHNESVRGRLRAVLPDVPWGVFRAASAAASGDAEAEAAHDDDQ